MFILKKKENNVRGEKQNIIKYYIYFYFENKNSRNVIGDNVFVFGFTPET
jgi:hypothetical protein